MNITYSSSAHAYIRQLANEISSCSVQCLHPIWDASHSYYVVYNSVAGQVPTIERRYRAQQMALWLDLIPRLHRAPNLGPTNFGPDECDHQFDDADRDSAFEQFAARVSDPDCSQRKYTPTVELPVGVTSFPVATRPSREHLEQPRTTQSYVTPRYRMSTTTTTMMITMM